MAGALSLACVVAAAVATAGTTADAAPSKKPKLGTAVPGLFDLPIPSSAVPDPKYPGRIDAESQFVSYQLPQGIGTARVIRWYERHGLHWHKAWNDWKWCDGGSEASNQAGSQTRTYSRGEGVAPEVLRIHFYKLGHDPAGISIEHFSNRSCHDYFKVPA